MKKRFNDTTTVFAIMLLAAVFYYLISDFDKSMYTLPDELRYLEAARALAHGKGLEYNGIVSQYQKILYSIVICPAFLVKNVFVQLKLVAIINSLLVASAVLPVYLLCKEEGLGHRSACFMCVFTVLFPETVSAMTFMSENLYYPLWMWIVYMIYRSYKHSKIRIFESIMLGFFGYLLYFCKEVGAIAVPVYLMLEIFSVVIKKEKKDKLKNAGAAFIVFVLCYLAVKLFVFPGAQNSYQGQLNGYEYISSVKGVAYAIYAVIYTLTYVILSLYIFPVLMPVKKRDTDFKFFIYLLICIVGIAVAVVYTVTLTEELFSPDPRLYLRYLSPLTIPLFSLFLSGNGEEETETTPKRKALIPFAVFAVVLTVLPLLNTRGLTDSSNLELFRIIKRVSDSFHGGELSQVFFVITKTVYIIIIAGGLILYRKNNRFFLKWFPIAVLIFNILCYGLKVYENRVMYGIPENEVIQMQEADGYLDVLEGKKLLICGRYYDHSMELMLTHHDKADADYYICGVLDDKIDLENAGGKKTAGLKDYSYFMIDKSVVEANKDVLDEYCGKTVWESEMYMICEVK